MINKFAAMKNLTFNELDSFANENIYNIKNSTETFQIQNYELNRFLHAINLNHIKIEEISRKLCLLCYYQTYIESDILEISRHIGELNDKVLNFEQTLEAYKYETPVDSVRKKQYNAAEKMFQKLKSFEHVMDIVTAQNKQNENISLLHPLEQVTKIMSAHLEMLESIEMKTMHMKNYLQLIENEKKKLLKLYKIKINKFL